MFPRSLRHGLTAAALLLPTAALAHDYTYIEGGYLDRDNGFGDDSGLRIAGSADVAPAFNLFGEYADTGDVEQLTAGGQFHTPLSSATDVFAGASLESIDVGPVDDTGYGLRAGLRWWAIPNQFELIPEVRHTDIFDEGATSLRLGGLVRIARSLDVQAAIQGGDDDRFEAGLRYGF